MEWKLVYDNEMAASITHLETFLSGMETPSRREVVTVDEDLETFLSGMETREQAAPRRPFRTSLKPSLVEWKLGVNPYQAGSLATLKPSLVEWKLNLWRRLRQVPTALETFLSGMETPFAPRGTPDDFCPLKPSLVEWKPAVSLDEASVLRSLETFLSGMETGVDSVQA